MKVSGGHTIAAPRQSVWEALLDPAVLARTLPGCQGLEQVGDDEYRVTVAAGVASVKGIYAGSVALADRRPPVSYSLRARGQGAPGVIDASARVTLSDTADGGTAITYEADAVVGGVVGGVGQRVLVGVAKRMAADFFTAVEVDLLAPAGPEPQEEPVGVGAPSATTGAGRVWRGAPQPSSPDGIGALLAAGVAGALIALLGVLVGRRTAAR